MKTLLIIRHAKSSNATMGQRDFDRPLAEKGKADAMAMGQKLLKQKVLIDSFISSPAKRAYKTCKLFAAAYHFKKEEIILADELYNAPENVFYKIIGSLDININHAAVFAHNPGITDFVRGLYKEIVIDDMPTCGVFAVSAATTIWKDFERAQKEFLFFENP